MTSLKRLAAAGAGLLCLYGAPALSQSETEDGRVVFEPAFFEQFNAVTALDMVNRVPGFNLERGGNERGFGGAAGNVLIDGERPSSKQGLDTILQRIPAADVQRIELIRGTTSGFDVRGQTQIVNVIRRADAGGSGSYEAQLKFREEAPASFRGNISRSLRLGAWELTANLERDTNRERLEVSEILTGADGDLVELRDERAKEYYRDWEGGVQAGAAFGAFSVNLNAQGEVYWFDWREPSLVSGPGGALDFIRTGDIDEDGYNYEFGGDVTRPLSDTLNLKLIGLYNTSVEDRIALFETARVDGRRAAIRDDSREEEGESLVRGFATWVPNDRHTVEGGVEGAFNFLDTRFTLSEDDGSGFVELDLPVSDTRIEELRGEMFGSWTYVPRPGLTLETGLVLEFSRITQSGDGANEREFFYPKPRAALTWARSDNEQISLLVERQVSQLDFDDFATSTSLSDDTTNLGNPDLEPFKTWRAEAEWERRFWEEGVVSLTLRYDLRQDAFDYLPVETVSGDRFDTWGNVGDATIAVVETSYAVPLDRLGLQGGLLSGDIIYTDAEVTDPLTGEDRPLSGWNDLYWYVEFRQDLADRPWAYGFDYAWGDPNTNYRLSELVTRENGHGDFDVFVERSNVFGATLRLDVENIGDVEYGRERVFFDPDRLSGVITGRESRIAQNGRLVRLTLRGTF
ncbi:MAG: TonB-dependent receptor plug domain-containing protein [Oceanicaulis sp.]